MGGALLRSGPIRDYHALGAVGNPVFSAATQLRAAMRRQLGADVANLFAIPKQSEDGNTIDWYAPSEGVVVPWSSATAEEQASARDELVAARDHLTGKSTALQAESDSERQIFGKLLAQATTIPSEAHVYLVDGRPVMTFWGFTERDGPSGMDVIGTLGRSAVPRAGDALLIEDLNTGAPPRRIPWWLWLLLLLLLLLLSLWLVRSCTETLPTPEDGILPPVQEGNAERDSSLEILPADTVRVTPDGDVVVDGTLTPGEQSITGTVQDRNQSDAGTPPVESPPGADDSAAPEIDPEQPPTPEDTPPGDDAGAPESDSEEPPTPEETPTDDLPPSEIPPETSSAEQPPVDAPPPPEAPDDAPLTIPQSAVDEGSTDFLNGRWRSETGLQDADTGQPVGLDYDLDDGKGTVTLSHGTGGSRQACQGPVTSSMESGRLTIQHEEIACPDGTTFGRSRVECSVGDGGRADCTGINEDQSTYDVEIGR